jgi:hypothetical protein
MIAIVYQRVCLCTCKGLIVDGDFVAADFSIGPNMEVYGAHGVTGLFAEGGPNLAEDMGALKSWMLSKMAWDVSLAKDWEKLMSEFLHGCA